MSQSWLWLTLKWWLARRWGVPLRLEPGRYGTDGQRLWRLPDKQAERNGQAKAPNHPDDGNTGASAQHSVRAFVHRAGDSRYARAVECDDGLREVREPTLRGRKDRDPTKHGRPVPKLRGVQRVSGLEDVVEPLQDLKDRVAYLAQSGHWSTTGQRWVDGKLAVHVHFTVSARSLRAHEVYTEQWCVDFEASRLNDEVILTSDDPVGLHSGYQPGMDVHGDWHKHTMLVAVREIPKPTYRFLPRLATVRLISSDDCPMVVRHSGEFGIDGAAPTIEPAGQREVNQVWPFRSGSSPYLYQIPGKMVEGGSEILKSVPEGRGALLGHQGYRGDSCERYCCIAADIDLSLDGDGVGIGVKHPLKSAVKGIEVLLRPMKLGPAAVENGAGHA